MEKVARSMFIALLKALNEKCLLPSCNCLTNGLHPSFDVNIITMNTSVTRTPKNSDWLIDLSAALFVLLFIYTAASKLLSFDDFAAQMHNQAIPEWLANALVWSVPGIEILTAVALLYDRTRLTGFWIAFSLMFLFTGYIVFVIIFYKGERPCSCGGVLKQLSWENHLLFNIFFLLLSILGIYMFNRERRNAWNR